MKERPELLLRARHHTYDREGEPITHFSVICEELDVGTIYLRSHLADDEAPWFWAVAIPLATSSKRSVTTSGREATREAAMIAFRHSFERVRIEVGEEGWYGFREHMNRINRRGGKT